MKIQRKREREENKISEAEEEKFKVFSMVISYLIMVIGTSYSNKYRFREISWDENEHAHRRFIWLQTLECETTSIELLRLNRAIFRKLCDILQSRGGLTASKNVTINEIVALFLHILAYGTKYRWIKASFARSAEIISRQFHLILKAVMKIGKYFIKEIDPDTNYQDNDKWKWFQIIKFINKCFFIEIIYFIY